jgi:hypothetical protein
VQLSAADKAVCVHRYSKLQSKSKRAGGWMQRGVRAFCVSRRNTRNRVGSAPPTLYSAFQKMQLRGQGEGGEKGGESRGARFLVMQCCATRHVFVFFAG